MTTVKATDEKKRPENDFLAGLQKKKNVRTIMTEPYSALEDVVWS